MIRTKEHHVGPRSQRPSAVGVMIPCNSIDYCMSAVGLRLKQPSWTRSSLSDGYLFPYRIRLPAGFNMGPSEIVTRAARRWSQHPTNTWLMCP